MRDDVASSVGSWDQEEDEQEEGILGRAGARSTKSHAMPGALKWGVHFNVPCCGPIGCVITAKW